MILHPNYRILFCRKTDEDVKEIIDQVRKILQMPQTQYLVQVIYGVNLKLLTDNATEISTNLVTNAVKYSDGDIEIEVEGPETRFMDRGPGVPDGDEERIFERFYRVDNSLTRTTGGSGIGLCISRALARGMGGDLTYSHRPGGGSVFTLKLKNGG